MSNVVETVLIFTIFGEKRGQVNFNIAGHTLLINNSGQIGGPEMDIENINESFSQNSTNTHKTCMFCISLLFVTLCGYWLFWFFSVFVLALLATLHYWCDACKWCRHQRLGIRGAGHACYHSYPFCLSEGPELGPFICRGYIFPTKQHLRITEW